MGHGEKILVIGRHAEMLVKITNMLTQNGYDAIGEHDNKEAIATFTANTIDAVVIGGGVDYSSRKLFHETFSKQNPSIKIIDAHPQTVLNDLEKAFSDKQ